MYVSAHAVVEHMRDREREKKRKRDDIKNNYIYKESIISRVFVLNSTAFAKPAFASMARKKLQLSVNLTSLYGETN